MSFRLDYEEQIPEVVERLLEEHQEIHLKIERIVAEASKGNLPVAISLLNLIKPQILRHAVEEEARIVRVIADKAKPELERNANVMRHHRRIEEFMQDRLPHFGDMPPDRVRAEIEDFAAELEKHHKEEEKISFPSAMKVAN